MISLKAAPTILETYSSIQSDRMLLFDLELLVTDLDLDIVINLMLISNGALIIDTLPPYN